MSTINREKISTILSEESAFSLFKKILKYIKAKIFKISKVIIFELALVKSVSKVATELELSFRMASEKDINSMDEKHYGYDSKGKQYSKDRLAKGDKCILALHNDKIIGYIWLMKDHMELSQYNHIPLPKNKAYTYNGFVLKKYRGKRVHAAMYAYIVDMLKKDGKRFVISEVDEANKPALKTKNNERGEFRKIGKIIQIRFLGLKYDYIKKKELKYLQTP